MYKICVYAICKNEEAFVNRWMDSMQEADMVVVTDTGSNDQTVNSLIARGAIVYTDIIKPWRFDLARNISLSHVPEDIDICVCTDLDEIFNAGWREQLESAWSSDATTGTYLYNWSHRPDGSPDVQFRYFKVHARKGYSWVHPVHECLRYENPLAEKKIFIPGLVLDHYPDSKKSRSSYLPLLELAVQEDPLSVRMTFYLGREYFFKGMCEQCVQTLEKYLALPTSTWKEERSAAMRLIGRCLDRMNHRAEAIGWMFRAIAEAPDMRDSYVACAQLAYSQANWPLTFCMCELALRIKQRSPTFINDGYAWDHTPHDLLSIACFQLGMYERSYREAQRALSMSPRDGRLMSNLKLIESKFAANGKQ